MDFETFKDQFTEDVKQALYERELDVKVSIHSIEKPNENYESMTVTPEGSNVGVNVNLNRFYDAYESGRPYDEVLSRAVDVTEKGIQESPEVNVSELTDYNFMKDKLAMEVVSVDTNADLLQNVPHHNIEDMAVIYRCVLSNEQDGMASIVVTNAMLDTFGVTQEQLHADALANAPEIKPAVITGMSEMMKQMMGDEEFALIGMDIAPADEVMYVATVPDKIHGAGVIAYQDFMDQAAEKIGGDFYVLPSSIHEVLLVRDDGNADFHDLEAMVQEVNATQVSPEEKLTDNVYHYDSKDHVFELAEKFEERMKAKEAGIDEQTEERGSILADLKAKKQECAAKPHEKSDPQRASKSKGGEAL